MGIAMQQETSHRAADSLSMNQSMAIIEAGRCLYCHDAPCTQACPVHIDVPGFIKRIREDNLAGSCELLYKPNPFARVCGLACPTANLCEGACVLPQMGQRAIRIGALQYFVASNAEVPEAVTRGKGSKKVAILGGGPAGLSCATALRRAGREVMIFESRSKLGGLMSHMIPSHRLPPAVVDGDLARFRSLNPQINLEEAVTENRLVDIVGEFDAVFIGVGLGDSHQLGVPGGNLNGVMLATDFLERARLGQGDSAVALLGDTFAVIGGGNVALDAACVGVRKGANRVIVLYRRTIAEMPGWRTEYEEAASLGVEFRWRSGVERILGEDGGVRGVRVAPMRRAEMQADGRQAYVFDDRDSTYDLRCDAVLLGLGQQIDPALSDRLGLATEPDGLIKVSANTFQSSNPKIFAGGEAVSGGSTLVQSIAEGMAAGQAIHEWLGEE
jgi:NADPH-dependent glutamate synthase beta subunit-like oxidoreductase